MIYLEKKFKNGIFFKYVPALVIIYFGAMILSTLGVWDMSAESVSKARSVLKDAILPSMIFLMLLRADLRDIAKLGPRMIISFFTATFTIMIGFVVAFLLFKGRLASNAPLTFGALAGSWVGGTQNMVAVQQAVGLEGSGMGYTLLIDSIDYSIWIMFLLFLVPFADKFNKWTKADTSKIDNINEHLTAKFSTISKEITFQDMFFLLSVALGVTAITGIIGKEMVKIPALAFMGATGWTIIITTILGVIFAMTPLARIPGSPEISNVLLYMLIGLIASNANFMELTQAPAYILAGFVILIIHGVLMAIIGKVFKLDLFTCGIASLSNIGGVASSPVLAAAYSQSLVPIAVLMALIGVITGTFFGIGVAKFLTLLA
ncbi:putative membrane protein [Parvimonas sp. oral taxon 393 str. F0440]|nr:putative membrane protein [Parvimonas sp. oral taxon 393 str. F0440]